MQTLSKPAVKTLEALTAGLKPGQCRTFGEKDGTYMQVHVECLQPGRFSVAHRYEQNGDLVSDPDMEFYRDETGGWLPVNCTLWNGNFTPAITFEGSPNGKPTGFYRNGLRELCSFASMWMRNIKAQQPGLIFTQKDA